MMSRWILGYFYLDLLFFILPGLVIIPFLPALLSETETGLGIGTFIIAGLLDGGHVYTTMWRTWLDREERNSSRGYFLVPAVTFTIVFTWIVLKIPYLWVALAYFTIYHNYRQFYGFTKWYEKINGRTCQFSGTIVQTLCIIPFILFHFRSNVAMGYMTDKDILVTPMPQLFHYGIYIYIAAIGFWLGLELDLFFRKKIFEPNRFLSILTPAILYGYGYLKGHVFIDIVFPLLVAHAISYFAAISLSLGRLDPKKYSFMGAFRIILVTAFVFGTFDHVLEAFSVSAVADYTKSSSPLPVGILIGIFITPLICHYIFDSWIWKYSHPKAKIVFTVPQPL